jgi:hypothetical protein
MPSYFELNDNGLTRPFIFAVETPAQALMLREHTVSVQKLLPRFGVLLYDFCIDANLYALLVEPPEVFVWPRTLQEPDLTDARLEQKALAAVINKLADAYGCGRSEFILYSPEEKIYVEAFQTEQRSSLCINFNYNGPAVHGRSDSSTHAADHSSNPRGIYSSGGRPR